MNNNYVIHALRFEVWTVFKYNRTKTNPWLSAYLVRNCAMDDLKLKIGSVLNRSKNAGLPSCLFVLRSER